MRRGPGGLELVDERHDFGSDVPRIGRRPGLGDDVNLIAAGRAGWDRASGHERGLLLDIFGIEQAPESTSAQSATDPASRNEARVVPEARPAPAAQHITPEVVALVDKLETRWAAPHAAAGLAEPEAGS